MTLQKTEKDCKQTKHFQQNLSATFALFPLCLARRKHKLFWPETRELKQERRLRKYFFNLDLTLNVTRNFKEHLFEHLKPIYSDLAQTFLVIHMQFVSISPISMFHLAPLAPECFLITWNPYQSSPSLLILIPSGYLLPLLMFFYLTYNSYSVVIRSLLQPWLSIFPSWLIVTSIKSNNYPEFIYSPCQSSSLLQ